MFDWLDQQISWLDAAHIAAVFGLAVNVLYAAVILIVAMFLSGWVKRRIEAISRRYPKIDDTLFSFLGSLAQYGVLAVAVIFVLNRFGIQTTSLVALIGAAGLAVGLALQGTLSNLAAGVMLVMFRPFRVGEFIAAGDKMGTVKNITLFYTEMSTYDGIHVIVPNGDIWSSAIINYSVNPTRMIDLTIGVAYDSDLQKVQTALEEVLAAEERGLADPAPFVRVKELGDSSIDFVVRLWVNRPDWWVTKCELTRAIKDRFDADGIDIPFPTRTLVMPPKDEAPQAELIPAE